MANDFLNDLSETLTKKAQGLGERVESLYETQKLRSRISGEERIVEKAMADIGRVIFEKFLAGEEIEEGLAALCEEAQEHLNIIAELKENAANKNGKKICPACKKAVDQSASFCPFCGTQVPNPEPACESKEEIAEEDVEEETEIPEEAETEEADIPEAAEAEEIVAEEVAEEETAEE